MPGGHHHLPQNAVQDLDVTPRIMSDFARLYKQNFFKFMKKPMPIVKLSLIIMRITLLHIVLSVAFSGFALASSTSSSFGQGILVKTVSGYGWAKILI